MAKDIIHRFPLKIHKGCAFFIPFLFDKYSEKVENSENNSPFGYSKLFRASRSITEVKATLGLVILGWGPIHSSKSNKKSHCTGIAYN